MQRWIWMVLLIAAALLVWRLWPRPAPLPNTTTPAPGVAIRQTTPADTIPRASMSQQPLEEVRPEVVSYVSQRNGRWVLHFLDGSSRELYPFELEQLPEQLRWQLEYRRGGS